MKKASILIIIMLCTLASKSQIDEPLKVKPHIDSLNFIESFIRFINEDKMTLDGITYTVDNKGCISHNYCYRSMSVASNVAVMWTGNPVEYVKTIKMIGGIRKFVNSRTLRHIMKRHFHYKAYNSGGKGMTFSPAMRNQKQLYKMMNKTLNGSKRVNKQRQTLEITNYVKDPGGKLMEVELVISTTSNKVITFFPKRIIGK